MTAFGGVSSATVAPAAGVAVVVAFAGLAVRLLSLAPGRAPVAARRSGSAGRDRPSWAQLAWLSSRARWWDERRGRRARRLAWPSVADEIGSALRSGSSLRQALGGVAAHGGAGGPRLAELVKLVSRGDDLAAAAGRWVERSEDADEHLLAGAIELAAGATRAEPALFDTVSRTLRERAALAGELRAQTAQARASAGALCALPLLFTGVCALADRSVLSFLTGTAAGGACLLVGVGLQGLGLWWMHRIIARVAP